MVVSAIIASLVATTLFISGTWAHPIDEVQGEAALNMQQGADGQFDVTITLTPGFVRNYTSKHLQSTTETSAPDLIYGAVAHAFAFEPCKVQTLEGSDRFAPVTAGGLSLRFRLICPTPLLNLEIRRLGYKQSDTRTTLYVQLARNHGEPLAFLLPPRLASLSIDLQTEAMQPGETIRGRVIHDTSPGALPSDNQKLSHFPQSAGTVPWYQPPPTMLIYSWFEEGAHHLLVGWDHLLFLLTLVLAARRLSALLGAVTGFSIGHLSSMTLALCLHLPAPAWLDVLIGATIAVSALRARLPRRDSAWKLAAIACGFGLIHGIGFGAGLQALTAGVDRLAWPLLSFGLGLDLAQTAWITMGWLALSLLHHAQIAQEATVQRRLAYGLATAGAGAGIWAAVAGPI